MNMSDRIKEQRILLHLTQEDLANRLGLQKSAIAKYENGRVQNIKRSTILKMSEIFGCSPSYLMALDNDDSVDAISPAPSLTADENTLLTDYRKLNEAGKNQALIRVSELTELEKYTAKGAGSAGPIGNAV